MEPLGAEQEELERYGLTPSSVAVVIGAFEGRTAQAIHELYGCQIFAFEPVEHACELFRQRLNGAPNVVLEPYALGAMAGVFPMEEHSNYGASFVGRRFGEFAPDARQMGQGEMREMKPALSDLGIREIDLLVMNIEGYEFYLLPYMLRHKMLEAVRYLLVQFHLKVEVEPGLTEICAQLNLTHRCRWDNGPSWMSWERRS